MAMAVIIASSVILTLFLASNAAAQTASVTAVCTYAQWTFYKNESPCQIWGNLQAACNPNAVVPKLDTSVNVDATYPSPTGANATACQCNVVAYNLMAGCSWCQPNVYSINWVTESQWKSGCANYDSTGLPAQASSLQNSIPPWALEIENGGAWEDFDASSIAAGGSLPTATFTAFSTGSGFGTAGGFGTGTGFGPSPTGSFLSGGDNSNVQSVSNVVARSVGIVVGVVGGISLITWGIVLVVFMTRQRNRKAWYGPTAEFYRNGGQMGDIYAPLSGAPQTSNPFTTPSPSAATTSFVTTPYQPPSPSNQNDPIASYGQGYAPAQYQQPPMEQYDPNANYGQAYPQYYDPNLSQSVIPNRGSTQPIPQV